MTGFRMAGVTLTVQSVKRSLNFYCNKLGMVPDINAVPHFALVKTDGGTIGFQSWAAAKKDGAARKTAKQKRAIHFEISVDDVDSLCEVLKRHKVKILRNPEAAGMQRTMVALDPDGYAIAFSEQ
jgi:catechol 2,3-dioxygenase-like lactoylglutathione lyase family enzyme